MQVQKGPGQIGQMLRINPYLLVSDVYKTAEYYRDVLGFAFEQFWGSPPNFVMVHRDAIQLMFCQPTDRTASVERPNRRSVRTAFDAYIYVRDVDSLYAELEKKGAKLLSEPTDRPHDCREFELEDCNGY